MQIFLVDRPATVVHKKGHSLGVPSCGNGSTKNIIVINFQPA